VKRSTKKIIARYWGYILLLLLFLGWFVLHVGPVPIGVVSVLVVIYCLVQAPVPCCALNRDGVNFCRNNANGIFGGCHLKSHQWQNLKMLLRRQSWARLCAGLFRRVSGHAATVSALAGAASAAAAVVTLAVKR
jgi:hypothetical protein